MIQMQGACGTCPSSTATLKMGIEKALRASFGDQLVKVVQVKKQEAPVELEAVDKHLDMLRPAIVNYGGSCEVVEVTPPVCRLRYVGPAPIRQGIQAAIKDKFPTILEVEFSET
jgi:Fe-S cluster biogenesis protein NfuA